MTNRNQYLDVLKGFTIVLVVLGHCIQYGAGNVMLNESLFYEHPVFKFIYSFHMPLFMMVSGYLFAFSISKGLGYNIRRRFCSLVVPILSWSILSILFQLLSSILKGDAISIIHLMKIPLTHLWFLWAVFWASCIVLLIHTKNNDSVLVYLLCILASFFIPDDYNIGMYKFVFPYFLMGYAWNKLGGAKRYSFNNIIYVILFLTFGGLLLIYDRNSYIYTSGHCLLNGKFPVLTQLGIDLYRYLIGVVGSCFVMITLYRLSTWGNTNLSCLKPIQSSFEYLGKNTLGIYIISTHLNVQLLAHICCNFSYLNFVWVVVETILMIVICLVLIHLIKRFPILNRYMLGTGK